MYIGMDRWISSDFHRQAKLDRYNNIHYLHYYMYCVLTLYIYILGIVHIIFLFCANMHGFNNQLLVKMNNESCTDTGAAKKLSLTGTKCYLHLAKT